MSSDSELCDDGPCDNSSVNIPIPKEFVNEFKEFFNNSKDRDHYKFLYNLDQLFRGSIWTENMTTVANNSCDKAILEKPIGMKTLDHYFSKHSRGLKKGKSLTPDSNESRKSSISPRKNSPSSSVQSSPRSKTRRTTNDSDVLSQDMFKNNSNENNDASDDEMILSTQGETSSLSKFNSSTLVSRSSCHDSSSSELDRGNKKPKRSPSANTNVNSNNNKNSVRSNPSSARENSSSSDSEDSIKGDSKTEGNRKSESPSATHSLVSTSIPSSNRYHSSSEDEVDDKLKDSSKERIMSVASTQSAFKIDRSEQNKMLSDNSAKSNGSSSVDEDSDSSGKQETKPQDAHLSVKVVNNEPRRSHHSSSSSDSDDNVTDMKRPTQLASSNKESVNTKDLNNSNGKKRESSSSSDDSIDEGIKKKAIKSVKPLQNRSSDVQVNIDKVGNKSSSSSESDEKGKKESPSSLSKGNLRDGSSSSSDKKMKHQSVNAAQRSKHEVSSSSDEADNSTNNSKSVLKNNEMAKSNARKDSSTSSSDEERDTDVCSNQKSSKNIKSNQSKSSDSSSSHDDQKAIKFNTSPPPKERNINVKDNGRSSREQVLSDSSSSSDENELSFKNKDIGKMLGLNRVHSARNMSCSGISSTGGSKVKTDNKASNFMEVDENEDSSSSEDSQDDNTKRINTINQTSLFAPAASSSFMVSTPGPNVPQSHPDSPCNSVKKIKLDHSKKSSKDRSKVSSSSDSVSFSNPQNTVIEKYQGAKSPNQAGTSESDCEAPIIDNSSHGKKRRRSDIEDSDGGKIKKKKKHSDRESLNVESDSDKVPKESAALPANVSNTTGQTWLENFSKKKRLIQAEERLNEGNAFCFEDISSEDELYTLQCPKELNIFSLVGKKISLSDESLFEGETKDQRSLAFEAFTMNLSSQVSLLLPSKVDSSFKLGNFKVRGSIIVSERCQVPEVDVSTFSATARESDSDEDSAVPKTPLPKGLKVRHPLHGPDYTGKTLPNFEAVILREKSHKKTKRDKRNNQDGGDAVFKRPSVVPSRSSQPVEAPKPQYDESVRGIVVGKNLISLVSDDESKASSAVKHKKKKKNRPDEVEEQLQQVPVVEDEVKLTDKKKKKKDKLMEQMIREMESNLSKESDNDGLIFKTKKEKKRKKMLEIEEAQEPFVENVCSSEDADIVKKKKKKKKKAKSDSD